MNIKEYSKESSRSFISKDETLDKLHCVIGACTEIGELADSFKRHVWYNNELDVVNVAEEIGDIQWYIFNLCRILDLDMEDILENNIEKLRERFSDKFEGEYTGERDKDAERKILEDKFKK